MSSTELLARAKDGDHHAQTELLEQYAPMLTHAALVDGKYDEDLYQELCITFLRCIQLFRIL